MWTKFWSINEVVIIERHPIWPCYRYVCIVVCLYKMKTIGKIWFFIIQTQSQTSLSILLATCWFPKTKLISIVYLQWSCIAICCSVSHRYFQHCRLYINVVWLISNLYYNEKFIIGSYLFITNLPSSRYSGATYPNVPTRSIFVLAAHPTVVTASPKSESCIHS